MINYFNRLIDKLYWAIINIFPLRRYDLLNTYQSTSNNNILVITIDYDKFSDRKVKVLKNKFQYKCGKDGLLNISEFCHRMSIPLLEILSSDIESCQLINKPGHYILKNFGTDISLLPFALPLITEFKKIIIINSSANIEDTKSIKDIYDFTNQIDGDFVVGFNGSSRLSPSFPYINYNPHVCTNFFAASSNLIKLTLCNRSYMKKTSDALFFSNKSRAIRNFEVQLSFNCLHNNGSIYLINRNGQIRSSYSPNDPNSVWPKYDTRYN